MPVVDAIGDAVLLPLLALINLIDSRMTGVVNAGATSDCVRVPCHCGAHQRATECECKKQIPDVHFVILPSFTYGKHSDQTGVSKGGEENRGLEFDLPGHCEVVDCSGTSLLRYI